MNPFLRFWDWLKPPGPEALGRADGDWLSMPEFGAAEDEYTWDDWEHEVAHKYPVRFWITHTFMRTVVRPITRRLDDAWYWFVSHAVPSRRYHLLDLRNPGPGIKYTHGWRDMVQVIEWACWVALRRYIEEEEPVDPASWASAEEMADEALAAQKAHYDEAMALYNWWMRERPLEEAERDRLLTAALALPRRTPERHDAMAAHDTYAAWADAREDEMLHRIINIRRRLWT